MMNPTKEDVIAEITHATVMALDYSQKSVIRDYSKPPEESSKFDRAIQLYEHMRAVLEEAKNL